MNEHTEKKLTLDNLTEPVLTVQEGDHVTYSNNMFVKMFKANLNKVAPDLGLDMDDDEQKLLEFMNASVPKNFVAFKKLID